MNELSDEGPVLGSGRIPLFASVLLLVGLFIGFRVTRTDMRLGLIIMGASAVPALLIALQYIRLRRALGAAVLEIKDDVVPLGWSGTVTYRRPLHGAELRALDARLVCVEHVEKGGGKSHREWDQIVVDEPLSPQSYPAMEQLRVQIPVKIPAAGPPTFHYTDNEINWFVRVQLKMSGCPNTRSAFKITVMPAVVGQ